MKFKFVIFATLIIGLGCFSREQPKTKSNVKSVVELKDKMTLSGFANFPLTIVNKKEKGDYFEYLTKVTAFGDTVALKVSLKKDISAGFVDGKSVNIFLQEGIILESMGKRSDRLLSFLSTVFKLNQNNLKLKERQIFTCANLNQEDVDYDKGNSRFKIFLEDEGGDYAELFVNFNFAKNEINLDEKDTSYRAALIKLLSN